MVVGRLQIARAVVYRSHIPNKEAIRVSRLLYQVLGELVRELQDSKLEIAVLLWKGERPINAAD
jgi:hypothetical protein